MPYRRKKFTFAISSAGEFLWHHNINGYSRATAGGSRNCGNCLPNKRAKHYKALTRCRTDHFSNILGNRKISFKFRSAFLHWSFWLSLRTPQSTASAAAELLLPFVTVNSDLLIWPDLRIWPRQGHDEPASQISRSVVIWFKRYCPNTKRHTHTHTSDRTDCSTWTTKVVVKVTMQTKWQWGGDGLPRLWRACSSIWWSWQHRCASPSSSVLDSSRTSYTRQTTTWHCRENDDS